MKCRIEQIDIAKGLGIILVVLGHCINKETILGGWIYNFHMPLFFIISGMCFDDAKYPKLFPFVWRRVKTLFIPLLCFVSLFLILSALSIDYYTIETIQNYKWPLAAWFIFVLFCCEIVYYGVFRIFKSLLLRLIILVLFLGISVTLNIQEIELPFSLSSVFLAVFYYGLGHSFKQQLNSWLIESQLTVKGVVFSFVLLAQPLVVYMLTNDILSASANDIPLPVVHLLVASLCGVLGVVYLCKLLSPPLVFENNFTLAIKSVILFCGKNTLVILCMHRLCIYLSSFYISPIIENHLGYKIIEIVVVCVGCFLSIVIINKWLPFFAGKKYIKK